MTYNDIYIYNYIYIYYRYRSWYRSDIINDLSRSKHSSVDLSGKGCRATPNLILHVCRHCGALAASIAAWRWCQRGLGTSWDILGHLGTSWDIVCYAHRVTIETYVRRLIHDISLSFKKGGEWSPLSDRDASGDPDLVGWSWLDWRQMQILWPPFLGLVQWSSADAPWSHAMSCPRWPPSHGNQRVFRHCAQLSAPQRPQHWQSQKGGPDTMEDGSWWECSRISTLIASY